MTLPPSEFSAIFASPTLQTAAAIFNTAQKPAEWGGDGIRIALLCPEARVVHATAAALALFGASGPAEIEGRLAFGEGPTARRVRYLAAAEPIGRRMRLERVCLPVGRRTKSFNMLCARIATPESLVFLLLSIPRPEDGAVQPNHPVLPAVDEASLRARFLWTLDAEERFGDPDPVLVAAVGDHAPRRGETLDALRLRAAIAPSGELVRALSIRATFSNLMVGWPLAGSRRVRIALSAAPTFDRHRDFAGYRGFGVIGDAFDDSEPLKSAERPAPQRKSEKGGRFGAKEAPGGVGIEPVEPQPAEAINSGPIGAQPLAGSRVRAGAESARPLDASEFVDDSDERARPDEARSPIGRIADAVARLLGASAPAVASPGPSGESHGAEIVVLRQASTLSSAQAKVVPIRPGALDAPSDSVPAPPGQAVELSKSERDAFREIAHALIGRAPASRDDGPSEANSADSRHAVHGPLDPSSPAAVAPTPQARPFESQAVGGETLGRNARAILDRLPIGVIVARDAQPLYLNRPLLDLLGYRDFAHFGEADGLAAIFQGGDPHAPSVAEGRVLRIVKADGQALAVEGRAQAIVWDREPATLMMLRPATEAVSAREGEADHLRQALDWAADGVVILDSAGRILSLNRAAERLFGCKSSETTGLGLSTLFAPQSQAAAIGRFENLSRSGEADPQDRPLHVAGRGKDGALLTLELTLARIGSPEAPRYCALFRDPTRERDKERRLTAARDAALAASAAKTDFLNKVSHEIRTPLHAILGIAEVMMEGRFGPIGNERYRDYLKDIYSSGRYMMSIADDLLDLNKIESGRLDLAFAPVDANSVIRECVSLMQAQAARDRIIMRLNLFERLPRVIVDERSLKQIMLNLISNAVKFNEPGGQVIVSTAVDAGGQAVIRVRDTGAGMSESEVGLAFEPFSQFGNTGRKGGAGLGLPLTKALVEANKAELTIKSRHQQGTLIEVAFPKVQAAQ